MDYAFQDRRCFQHMNKYLRPDYELELQMKSRKYYGQTFSR